MNESVAWLDTKYAEVMEEELRGLERRRGNDLTCTVGELEKVLTALYVQEGNNWEGRGALQDTILSATIAAYERFISEWKTETGTHDSV